MSAGELARLVRGELLGPAEVALDRIEALDQAGPGSVTFVRSHKYARRWAESRASAAIITRDVPLHDLIPNFDPARPDSPRPLIVVADADLALIACLPHFAPPPVRPAPGIHPTATVDPAAKIDPTATIGPGCVISAGASVGSGTVLVAQVFLGEGATVGRACLLHPQVAVAYACVIGDQCTLHCGVVVGADGFGFHPAPDGRGLLKVPHVGNVVVGTQVEIGANSCVDRAKFGSTTIGDGTKIDNLVQIGHGCRIGRCCILCGQVGLAGSVVLGDGVVMGGKSGVSDGIEIGAGSQIAGGAGVSSHTKPNSVLMGIPAGPASEWRRIYASMRRLARRREHPTE